MVLAGAFAVLPLAAQQFTPAAELATPPDKHDVSYALGMNLAEQIKGTGADVDIDAILRGMNDVLEDKPTRFKPSELRPIFEKAQAALAARMAEKNLAAGKEFMDKNAKAAGVKVLPDGLQYRAIEAGTGPLPGKDDTVSINYTARLIDGTEFQRAEGFQTPVAGTIKAWAEVLPMMRTGSRWEIFAPADLAYGGRKPHGAPPGSTVVFDIKLLSIEPKSTPAPASK